MHPIRWPGSWHRKKEPKLCRIVALNDDAEIDLATALEVLKQVAPSGVEQKKKKTAADYVEEYGQEGKPNWGKLIGQVLSAESYHEPLVRLAAKLIKSGMSDGAAGNLLRGWMEASAGPRDERWKARYNDIDRSVSTAQEKFGYGKSSRNQREEITASTTATRKIDPVDLWAHSVAPALPKGLLPSVIEEFAFVQGELMGGDPAGLAMGALTVCAAIIPDRIKLQVKKNDPTWTEATRIWCALVGDPSTKKTPIMGQVMRPIERIDEELRRKFARAMAVYKALPAEERQGRPEPMLDRISIEDIPPEAAQEILKDNDDGMLLSRDELSGCFGGMDKYRWASRSRQRSWFLAASIQRQKLYPRSRGAWIGIKHLSVSMLGGIPACCRSQAGCRWSRRWIAAADQSDHDEKRSAGIGRWNRVHRRPSTTKNWSRTSMRCDASITTTSSASMMARRRSGDNSKKKHLKLSLGYERFNKRLGSHIAKYDGMFARLCLLWHVIEHHHEAWPSYIDEYTAQRVAKFMHEFLLPHAIAFYRNLYGLSDQHERLIAVAGTSWRTSSLNSPTAISSVECARCAVSIAGILRVSAIQLNALGWVNRVPGRRLNDPPKSGCEPRGASQVQGVCGVGDRAAATVAGADDRVDLEKRNRRGRDCPTPQRLCAVGASGQVEAAVVAAQVNTAWTNRKKAP